MSERLQPYFQIPNSFSRLISWKKLKKRHAQRVSWDYFVLESHLKKEETNRFNGLAIKLEKSETFPSKNSKKRGSNNCNTK